MESKGLAEHRPDPGPRPPRDCAGLVKTLTDQGERWAQDMRQRFRNTIGRHRGRHDLAWWPADPDHEPLGPEGCFFYRPGQLLVNNADLEQVECVLSGLGVESCARTGRKGGTVTRLLAVTTVPTPLLVRQLRRLGLGARTVTLNHVWFPADTPTAPDTFTLDGAPWLSGGAESVPLPSAGTPSLAHGNRGEGVQVAVFDTELIDDWKNPATHPWMCHVEPFYLGDVEPPAAGTAGTVLDIYDSHGVAVAGVVAARAPGARIRVRDVLSELGEVDEWGLIGLVSTTLRDHPDIDIVNMSLGGTTRSDDPPIELGSLLAEFPRVIFVASAGNNGLTSPHRVWPAAFPGVIGVGALDGHGTAKASFSNDSPSADVWAPGTNVLTAFGSGSLDYPAGAAETFAGMATWSGTSFSAPYVSGVLCQYVAQRGPLPAGPAAPGVVVGSQTDQALNWLRANASVLRADPSGDQILLL
jgi:hypothetical protein